jgi:hypothetical protein
LTKRSRATRSANYSVTLSAVFSRTDTSSTWESGQFNGQDPISGQDRSSHHGNPTTGPKRSALAENRRSLPRYKLGTSRTTQYQLTSTNINQHLRRRPAVPNAEALVRVLPAALHQQTHHRPRKTCPRRAGRSPGWPTQASSPLPGLEWGDWVGHPVDLPKGYHALPRGQAWQARPVVP